MAGSLAQDARKRNWLRPAWVALETLTADRPNLGLLSADPGTVLGFMRVCHSIPPANFVINTTSATQPLLCVRMSQWLSADTLNFTDWTRTPNGLRLLHTGRSIATVAARLANETGRTAPASAWTTGLLSLLGWYALGAANPTAGTLSAHSPAEARTLTRQLAVRYRLPNWLAATIGWLTTPAEHAVRLGADAGVFPIVQAAVAAVCPSGDGFPAFTEIPTQTLPQELVSRATELRKTLAPPSIPETIPADATIPPSAVRVMVRLLQTTAQLRDSARVHDNATLETRIDQLESFVSEQQQTWEYQVQDARLRGLAEFAAGASHEINNPLMIILGNSRILAEEEVDSDRIERFESIARSTHRISELLSQTRLFARPPVPRPKSIALTEWLATHSAQFTRRAEERSVQFDWEQPTEPIPRIWCDPEQLRQALSNLIQNALEAVEPGGWVRLGVNAIGCRVILTVEDSGPGPDAAIREHLFDPFFCGRPAGRHPGLGLPVAWRLVEQNGGNLRYAPNSAHSGRFELHLPIYDDQNGVIRKSA